MNWIKKPGFRLILLGSLLLLGAAVFAVIQVMADHRAEEASEQLVRQIRQHREAGKEVRNKDPLPKNVLGILEIPALELELPVLRDYNEEDLQQYLCRYGQERCRRGQQIIAGHNYRSQFAKLTELKKGDTVRLTVGKKKIDYKVDGIREIHGEDMESMFAGDWELTLFTCNFTGAERITVRCSRAVP